MGKGAISLSSIVITSGSDINVDEMEKTMTGKLQHHRDPPTSAECCIFKVPDVLRRQKPEAYQPDFLSIGPLHHRGGEQFQHTENVKKWYLNSLLSRMNLSLKTLIEKSSEFEQRVRDCYAAKFANLNKDEFLEMMILDGCFIIEFVQKSNEPVEVAINENDPIFKMSCMFQYICHDLLLLENQLPWSFLKQLYDHIGKDPAAYTLKELVLIAFTSLPPLSPNCRSYLNHHGDVRGDDGNILHILDLIRTSIVFSFRHQIADPSSNDLETQLMHSATALSETGVKFKKVDVKLTGEVADSIMNIEFKDGVLTIPRLEIGELTEPMFRNLIAFEQCYHGRPHEITSYAVFMANLIGSDKDMELLCTKKIVGNWLSPEDGSEYFNKLHNDTLLNTFYYSGLCIKLNAHYEDKWNTWLEKLKRDYFSNPWAVIALIAASIILVLTVLQTVYSIRQYYSPPQ